MPAPIVAAAALAAKVAKLTMRQKAGKAVVNATTGKTSARKYAESAARSNAKKAEAKAAVKAAAKRKPLANPKSAVRVKPAAKQVGNPRNDVKAWESVLSSASRGGAGSNLGKIKEARKMMSKNPVASGKASRPVASPSNPDFRSRVKINTDPSKPKGIFGSLKKKAAAANTRANRAKAKANSRGLKAANKKSK